MSSSFGDQCRPWSKRESFDRYPCCLHFRHSRASECFVRARRRKDDSTRLSRVPCASAQLKTVLFIAVLAVIRPDHGHGHFCTSLGGRFFAKSKDHVLIRKTIAAGKDKLHRLFWPTKWSICINHNHCCNLLVLYFQTDARTGTWRDKNVNSQSSRQQTVLLLISHTLSNDESEREKEEK